MGIFSIGQLFVEILLFLALKEIAESAAKYYIVFRREYRQSRSISETLS